MQLCDHTCDQQMTKHPGPELIPAVLIKRLRLESTIILAGLPKNHIGWLGPVEVLHSSYHPPPHPQKKKKEINEHTPRVQVGLHVISLPYQTKFG